VSPNRLAQETSPYLLQHRDNPVDWYPWGPDALERARAEDRPIFLSIGYAACHWCHVMEHESFEDEETAADLNRSFVSVKVDREERPDLDAIYMDAVQALTGQGGWPMSVFLTPDGRPFYGGTYFPNERRYGMPAFRDVLAALERAWREQRAEVESSAARLAEAIDRGSRLASAPIEPDEAFAGRLERAVGALRGAFDPVNGDRIRAPHVDPRGGSRGPGDGPHHAGTDGRRRDPRSSGRRFPPLRNGRDLAGSPLREDALRQRPPGHGVSPRVAGDR
jgi:uncharacterized protein YyaL (SSP411 family)